MSRYYGTAVHQPAGTGRPPQLDVELPPRPQIEWCEEAGCPRDKCVACRESAVADAVARLEAAAQAEQDDPSNWTTDPTARFDEDGRIR